MATTIHVLLALTIWMGEELDVHVVNVFQPKLIARKLWRPSNFTPTASRTAAEAPNASLLLLVRSDESHIPGRTSPRRRRPSPLSLRILALRPVLPHLILMAGKMGAPMVTITATAGTCRNIGCHSGSSLRTSLQAMQILAILAEVGRFSTASPYLTSCSSAKARRLEQSATRADELVAEGHHNGAVTWRRITDTVLQLANTTPPGPLH